MRYTYDKFSAFGYFAFLVCMILVQLYFNPDIHNKEIVISILFGLLILSYLAKLLLTNLFYEKFSILFAPKSCVVNKTTLKNAVCTVIFKSNDKIIVLDNVYNSNNSKRMFSISKKDVNISKQWDKICKFFDNSSSLDSLASFCNLDTNIEIIPFDTKLSVKRPEVVPMSKAPVQVQPDDNVVKTVVEKSEVADFDKNVDNSNIELEDDNIGRIVDL